MVFKSVSESESGGRRIMVIQSVSQRESGGRRIMVIQSVSQSGIFFINFFINAVSVQQNL